MEDVSDFSARKLMERNIMKKIILDLDTGIDDTLALSYILGSEDAEPRCLNESATPVRLEIA